MNQKLLDKFLLIFMENLILRDVPDRISRDMLRGCQATIKVLMKDENNLLCLNLNPLLDKLQNEFPQMDKEAIKEYYS